jgi:hypothetical protein
LTPKVEAAPVKAAGLEEVVLEGLMEPVVMLAGLVVVTAVVVTFVVVVLTGLAGVDVTTTTDDGLVLELVTALMVELETMLESLMLELVLAGLTLELDGFTLELETLTLELELDTLMLELDEILMLELETLDGLMLDETTEAMLLVLTTTAEDAPQPEPESDQSPPTE